MYTWNDIKTGAIRGWQSTWSWMKNNIYWMGIIVTVIIILASFHSCASTPTVSATKAIPAPGAGWLFLKLAFAGLIIAAYYAREHRYLAGIFAGLSVLVFLVLLGKLDSLMAWGTLGLPIMAAFGIRGYGLLTAGTRMKSFLGFTSGILILFWVFLLYLGYSDQIHIGFLGALFPDDMAKIIFTVFLAIFFFAIWKKSKIFYAISFIVFLSFLGNNVVNEIATRFPEKLTPPKEFSAGVGEFLKDLSNKIDKAFTPAPPPPAPPPPIVVPRPAVSPPIAPAVVPTPPPVQKVVPHVVTPEEARLARVRAGQEQQGSAVWVEPLQSRRVYYPERGQYPQYHHEPPRHHDRYYRW